MPSTMHVITGLHGGGAERLLTNLIGQQKARGEELCVVSLTPGGIFRSTLESAGVDVTDLGMSRRRDALRGLLELALLIRDRRPAVVQGWMYHANVMGFLALLIAGRKRTRLIWGIFCSNLDSSAYHWSFRMIRGLGGLLSRYVDGIIYNAGEARDFHHAIGFREPRSVVISNCVDPAIFRRDLSERSSFRDSLQIAPDDVMLVVVARVDPMKDWSGMLEAVRELPGIVTVAVGTGTDQLPPQSGFVGLGWRDDVARILSAADVFLLPSAFGEGSSLALEEAMSCSLPCIVTEVGGSSALVGEAGIVVEPRNPAAIRAAVLRLASDREHREALGRAGRARAMALNSAEEIARSLRHFSLPMEAAG